MQIDRIFRFGEFLRLSLHTKDSVFRCDGATKQISKTVGKKAPSVAMLAFNLFLVLTALFGQIFAFAANPAVSKIAIFGGTGQTGRECVFQALKADHKVVVLARNPAKLLIPPGSGGDQAEKPMESKNLFVIQGDVTDAASVDALFAAHPDISGVIVALGGRTKDVGPTMLTVGTTNIVRSMKAKSKAKRIATVTVIGTGDSEKSAPLKFKLLMYTMMRSIYADKNRQEKIFLDPTGDGHELEYVLFSMRLR